MSARYVIGYWCNKGGGHLDLYSDPDADMACGSHMRPVFIEADRNESRPLPAGRFEDDDT